MRREEHCVYRKEGDVNGSTREGKAYRRWLDKLKGGIKEKGLSADGVYDRAKWRRMSSHRPHIDPT